VDFYTFIANFFFCVLGNKDVYGIFKDMLYNLCFISHKLLFNVEIFTCCSTSIDFFL